MRPVIISAFASPEIITNGGIITLTIIASSESPVYWLQLSFDGPAGNIEGGGGAWSFTETSSNVWENQRSFIISSWAPSGIYSFSDIIVKNEAELWSTAWPNPIEVTVNN
jgi:hypothetical protein